MTTQFVLKCVAIPGVLALIVWMLLMLGLRKEDKKNLSHNPELLSREIEYHNKATYRTLEFYLKVLLAVLGGVAYLVLFHSPLKESGRLLLVAAGWIVGLVSALFCIMIFVHQK